MNKVTLFATASLFVAGISGVNAQVSATSTSFSVASVSTGTTYSVSTNGDNSTVFVPRNNAGLLRVRVAVSYDPTVVLFTMAGPYGTNSSFAVALGSISAIFGQYLYAPLAVEGSQVYTVKSYDFLGGSVSTKTLTISLRR